MSLFVICLIRAVAEKKTYPCEEALKSVDYFTLGLLAVVFIVIAGKSKAGVVDAIAGLFCR
jgi:di/tricarboxylate transporter